LEKATVKSGTQIGTENSNMLRVSKQILH